MHQVLLESKTTDLGGKGKGKDSGSPWVEIGSSEDATGLPKVVYEINTDSDHFEPRMAAVYLHASSRIVATLCKFCGSSFSRMIADAKFDLSNFHHEPNARTC